MSLPPPGLSRFQQDLDLLEDGKFSYMATGCDKCNHTGISGRIPIIEIIEFNNVIDKKDILNNPNNYLLQNAYPNILELIDYQKCNILYLHISGQPLGVFDPKFKNMMNILNALGAKYQHRQNFEDGYYFSSHAVREQLLQYLEEVECKLIVPCHSAK